MHGRKSMDKIKSSKNKTIDFSIEQCKQYIEKCVVVDNQNCINLNDIINKTILGDTFELLKKMPDSSVDLIIADPPYNLSKDYHGNKFKRTSTDEYKEFTAKWLQECKRIMKPNATIYVCCDWKSSLIIGEIMFSLFNVQNRITWQREKGRGALSNWKNAMEDIWFATKSKEYTFNVDKVMCRRKVIAPYKVDGKPKDWEETADGNFRNTYPSNFWDDISIPYWSMPENTEHPTQKPEKLIAKLILASSDENDIVFDGCVFVQIPGDLFNGKFCRGELLQTEIEKRLVVRLKEKDTVIGQKPSVLFQKQSVRQSSLGIALLRPGVAEIQKNTGK